MKLITRLGAAAFVVACFTGCDTVKGETNKASNANSTAKDPGQGAPKDAKPANAPAIDPRDYMQAPSKLAWPAGGAGVTQGWWLDVKSAASGTSSTTHYAVVAIAGDQAKVEMTAGDYIEALVVKMADGTVTWAGAGKKGEKAKQIKIAAAGPTPDSADEDVTVKAGTFKSKKQTLHYPAPTGDIVTWIGVDDPVKELMLKNTVGANTTSSPRRPRSRTGRSAARATRSATRPTRAATSSGSSTRPSSSPASGPWPR